MIVLGWIGVFVTIAVFVGLVIRGQHDSYKESMIDGLKCATAVAFFFMFCFSFIALLGKTFKPSIDGQDTPTVLSCNGIVVAESIDGFSYSSKSGSYQDYRGKLTYTPKHGEVCKEYRKEDK